jgi:hypothetical protein
VRLSFVAAGPFLSIFSASVLTFPATRHGIKVLPIELPTARVPNGIVTLKKCALSSVAQIFVEQVREIAKPLAKQKLKAPCPPLYELGHTRPDLLQLLTSEVGPLETSPIN